MEEDWEKGVKVMVKYDASKEDQYYWRGAMDTIGLLKMEGILSAIDTERARSLLASMQHTHYQSVLGPYCVVCHLDLVGPEYKKWKDGQESL